MAFNGFALPLLILGAVFQQANSKTYPLQQGWASRNGPHLPEVQASDGSMHRLLTATSNSSKQQMTITSDNGTFGLAFFRYSNTSSDFYLSLIFGAGKTWGVPVWSANRNNPVGENATLLLTAQTSLSLQDKNGTVVWSSSVVGIVSLDVPETGNFSLNNSTGNALWKSFDHPTDCLLVGQSVSTGQKFVGSASNSTMEEGIFEAVIEVAGFVMYLNWSDSKMPYFVWSLAGSDAKSTLIKCSLYVTQVTLNSNFFNMGYRLPPGTVNSNGASACIPDTTVFFPTSFSNAWLYVRLDSNGDLIVFSRAKDNTSSGWTRSFQLQDYISGKCELPMTCGPYGICTNDGCKCLRGSKEKEIYQASQEKCTDPTWAHPTCVENEAANKHFLTLSNTSYSSIEKYGSPDKISTLADCKSLCLGNCSCRALFFDGSNGHCYFLDQALGSMTQGSKTVTALLKFSNIKFIPTPLPRKGLTRLQLILICIAVISFVFLLALVVVLYIKLRKTSDELDIILSSLQGPPHRFSYQKLQACTNKFSNKLGSGGFGTVYKGSLPNGKELAVKKLETSSQGQKEFIAEVVSMGSISHTNIVKLCGFCAERSHKLLVYEYMPNGSLDQWIFYENNNAVLDWKTRYQIALGTARGLAYLHNECHDSIIHLDIKPQNILLDYSFNPKVSDFGLSKLLGSKDTSQVNTCVRGTPGYLAPEWLLQSVATKKCDVYSYGMVLLELVGGRKNLDSTKLDSNLSWYFPAWVVNEIKQGRMNCVIDPKLRAEASNGEYEEEINRLIKTALWCIQENPASRPGIEHVVGMLEGVEKIDDPPLDYHFTVQAQGIIDISSNHESFRVMYVQDSSTISLNRN